MSPSLGISRIRLLVPVLDLLLCALGFYAAILIFSPAGADRQADGIACFAVQDQFCCQVTLLQSR